MHGLWPLCVNVLTRLPGTSRRKRWLDGLAWNIQAMADLDFHLLVTGTRLRNVLKANIARTVVSDSLHVEKQQRRPDTSPHSLVLYIGS